MVSLQFTWLRRCNKIKLYLNAFEFSRKEIIIFNMKSFKTLTDWHLKRVNKNQVIFSIGNMVAMAAEKS